MISNLIQSGRNNSREEESDVMKGVTPEGQNTNTALALA